MKGKDKAMRDEQQCRKGERERGEGRRGETRKAKEASWKDERNRQTETN